MLRGGPERPPPDFPAVAGAQGDDDVWLGDDEQPARVPDEWRAYVAVDARRPAIETGCGIERANVSAACDIERRVVCQRRGVGLELTPPRHLSRFALERHHPAA